MNRARWMSAWTGLVLLASAPRAYAQCPRVARDQLLDRAVVAHEAGDPTRALELALCAYAVEATGSLDGFIAGLYLDLGRHLDAYRRATACVRSVAGQPPTPVRVHYQRLCPEFVAEAQSHLGRVALRSAAPLPPEARVSIAGEAVEGASSSGAHWVTPGRVVVEARAPGHEPFRHEVEVAAGAVREVEIGLRPISGSGVGPWVLVGAGGASLLTAGVLYAVAVSAANESRDLCPDDGSVCREAESREAYSRAAALQIGSVIALSLGAAAVAGGVVWYLAARPSRSREVRTSARAGFSWGVAPTAGGVSLTFGGRL